MLGCRSCDCLNRGEMLRSRTNMKIPLELPRPSHLIGLLIACLQMASFAQVNTAAPPIQRPPSPPGQRTAQSSKMLPTGLGTNGGSIANGVYSNSIYGFSLKTPPGWAVVPSKDPNSLKSESGDSAVLKAAQINHTLLVMTENAPLKKAFQRKALQILATRLLAQTGPTSAQDYLAYSQKTAQEKGMAVEYLGSPEEVTVKGQKLWKVASNEPTNGTVEHVEQYVIVRGAILLQFFIVSPDEAGLKDLEPTIQSLEFKPIAQKPSPRSSRKPKTSVDTGSKPQ
jgi:hypothetical protein